MRPIQLRRVTPSDLQVLFAIESEAQGNAMAVVRPRSETEFMEQWSHDLSNDEIATRVIVVQDRVAGVVSRFRLDGRDAIGYRVTESLWGQGIATEAVRLFLDEILDRPLWARVASSNKASIRVLEKCGFGLVQLCESVESLRYPACKEHVMRLDA